MEEDPLEGPSHIFNTLLGGITEEQWRTYKEMKKMGSGLVIGSDSEEEEEDIEKGDEESLNADDSRLLNFSLHETDSTFEDIFQSKVPDSGLSEVSEEETENQISSWESNLTVKYVNGELSFDELANIMENRKMKSTNRKSNDAKEGKIVESREATPMEIAEKEYDEEVKKIRKKRRKMNHLPKCWEGLMGAANLSYARGEKEDAIKMLLELVRVAPTAQEPFQTLGMIYEEMGDTEKSLQFFLIAAYLNPSDAEEWVRLAEISLELGHVQQAISCYSNAIRNDPTNINLLWERCNLYEQQGDRKRALAGYELILQQLNKPEEGEQCVQMSREIAKIHYDSSDQAAAIQVLEMAFSKFPKLISSEDINMLLELQIQQKRYKDVLKNLVQHCGVILFTENLEILSNEELEHFNDDEAFQKIQKCEVSECLPIDFQIKLADCLIRLKALDAVQELLVPLKQESPEDMGDLYLDVAEAFMDVSEHRRAMPFLTRLVKSKNYSYPAVWLKYGDCLSAIGEIEEAAEAYKNVVKMAPSHLEARLSLSGLLQQMGRTQDAINTLKQEYEDGKEDAVLDLELLFQRCNLLYSQKQWDEFIEAAKLAQYSHCYPVRQPEEFNAVLHNQSYKRRNEALREISVPTPVPTFIDKRIPISDMWDLYMKVCGKLFEFGRLEELQNLAIAALTSTLFMKDPTRIKDIEFLALLASYYNRNNNYAYLLVKDLVLKDINNPRAWNLFCQVITFGQDIRHNKFCLRLMMKHQDHRALGYLNGHNAMISGSYKHALGEYMCVLKEQPSDSFVAFCVGITFIHMACQKFASKRHSLTIQGTVFLNRYLELRGECQETMYNLGRAMHQLGLMDFALHYYKKALDFSPSVDSGPHKDVLDLRRETAYNMALIYQASGATNLAYMYINKYIVI